MSDRYANGVRNGKEQRDRQERQRIDMNGVRLDQSKLEAAQVEMKADIVRIDGKLGIVVHTLLGDGVEGLADEVKGIKVWIAGMADRDSNHVEKRKVNRNRNILIVVSIIGSIILLITFIATVSGWIRNSRPIRRLPTEIKGKGPVD
jgi:hypothetical protein